MPHNLTAVDEYTTDVPVPSGGDARTALSLEAACQPLANRSLNAKNRLDVLEMFAAYAITGTSIAVSAKPTLTEMVNVGGFTLSSNEIVVPEVGTYLVHLAGVITCDDTSNPAKVGFEVKDPTVVRGQAEATRFSATTAHRVNVTCLAVVVVTDVANHIVIKNAVDSAGAITIADICRVAVLRVS